ncbi:hypothetical protein BGX38DRAFT_443559 [Terfezia claveryi]|nr:hypothetical protein BGX38DRAFT_443559 [Terfezia claveryi]
MFVPRQLAIKKPATHALSNITEPQSTSHEVATAERPFKRPRIELDIPRKVINALNNVPEASLSHESATEVLMCLELLFSEYSTYHINPQWLPRRMRTVDGYNDYIHVSALLENDIFKTIKPQPTQKTLVTALQLRPSQILQVSPDGYHLRRRHPVKQNVDNRPKEAWEPSTIYIEPDIRGVSACPGKVARILAENNPSISVEWVESGGTAWAFVIVSENVNEQQLESCEDWPSDWIVMSKAEWRRRDGQYQKLRESAYQQISNPTRENQRQAARHDFGDPKSSKSRQPSYFPGIIIYLNNLHPDSTKPGIQSFLSRSFQRYTIKKLRKTTSSTRKGGFNKAQTSQDFTIDYVDYKPKCGFTTAHVRVKTSEDAELLVRALNKRRRCMKSGDGQEGEKKCNVEDDRWVKGEVIRGEREKVYWDVVSNAKGNKKLW